METEESKKTKKQAIQETVEDFKEWRNGEKEQLRVFLEKKKYKEPLIFLACLAISFIFWLMVVMNEVTDHEFRIPVKVEKVPDNEVIMNLPDTIKVTVRDRGFAFFAGMKTLQKNGAVIVNYESTNKGNGSGALSSSELRGQLRKLLGFNSSQMTISPSELAYKYSLGTEKNIPVVLAGEPSAEESHYITKIDIEPDSVRVFAPTGDIDKITEALTKAINQHNIVDTLTIDVPLAKITNARLTPEAVKVTFYTDILTEEYIDVPIRAINVPNGKVIKTFPSTVKVKLIVGAKFFKTLKPTDIDIVVDYDDIAEEQTEKCNLYLLTRPEEINVVQLQQLQTDYLIETTDTTFMSETAKSQTTKTVRK